MKQETINLFIGLILGFFLCLIFVAAIKVHLIDPKQKEIMAAMAAKQTYYEELSKSSKCVKYFVKGPMMVVFLDTNSIWTDETDLDPNKFKKP